MTFIHTATEAPVQLACIMRWGDGPVNLPTLTRRLSRHASISLLGDRTMRKVSLDLLECESGLHPKVIRIGWSFTANGSGRVSRMHQIRPNS